MTNKIKFILPVLALGLLLSSIAFAQNTAGTTVTSGTTTTRKECVASAKTTRDNAIKSASDIAKQAKLDAKTTKDAAFKIK